MFDISVQGLAAISTLCLGVLHKTTTLSQRIERFRFAIYNFDVKSFPGFWHCARENKANPLYNATIYAENPG